MINPRKLVALVVLSACCLTGALDLAAAQVSSELGSLGERFRLQPSAVNDILRAYRGAVNVGVNPKRLESLITQALAAGMDTRHLVRALALVTNVSLDGLPQAPVLNRFGEGLAKKVEGDEIVEAMERRALSLKQARRLVSVLIYRKEPLGELETVLVAVAGALERGAEEEEIEEAFREEGPDLKKIVLKVESLP